MMMNRKKLKYYNKQDNQVQPNEGKLKEPIDLITRYKENILGNTVLGSFNFCEFVVEYSEAHASL